MIEVSLSLATTSRNLDLIRVGKSRRVDLAQLVRFLVIELVHSGSNPRFDIDAVFTTNYFFSGRRCLRQQRDVLDDRLYKS
jgi:hypothetical protein